MYVSEAQRLKVLEGGNAKLKKLLAASMLDFAILKGEPLSAIASSPMTIAAKNGNARYQAEGGGTCRDSSRGGAAGSENDPGDRFPGKRVGRARCWRWIGRVCGIEVSVGTMRLTGLP